jgi:hypothetical protein
LALLGSWLYGQGFVQDVHARLNVRHFGSSETCVEVTAKSGSSLSTRFIFFSLRTLTPGILLGLETLTPGILLGLGTLTPGVVPGIGSFPSHKFLSRQNWFYPLSL